jgi:hypothetical protein
MQKSLFSVFIALGLFSCSSIPSSKIHVINGHCEPVIFEFTPTTVNSFDDSLKNQEKLILYYKNLENELKRCTAS